MGDKMRDHCTTERSEDELAMLTDLPRFGQTNATFNEITQDPLVWKRMCSYHFNDNQIITFKSEIGNDNHTDWKHIYQLCYKKFGHTDQYSDMTVICSHCCSIHWKCLGHKCL